MTIQELYKISDDLVFVRWEDGDGKLRYEQYRGKDLKHRRITHLGIKKFSNYGHVIVVELAEE